MSAPKNSAPFDKVKLVVSGSARPSLIRRDGVIIHKYTASFRCSSTTLAYPVKISYDFPDGKHSSNTYTTDGLLIHNSTHNGDLFIYVPPESKSKTPTLGERVMSNKLNNTGVSFLTTLAQSTVGTPKTENADLVKYQKPLPSGLQAKIAEKQLKLKDEQEAAAVDYIIALTEDAAAETQRLVKGIQDARALIAKNKKKLDKISDGYDYGYATSNYIPLLSAVRGESALTKEQKALNVIPAGWSAPIPDLPVNTPNTAS